MAVLLKSQQEIAHLREAGRIVAETFEVLRPYTVPGKTTLELDRIAEDYIRSKGATPVYKGYGAQPGGRGRPPVPPFPGTICTAINEVICHGIPGANQVLKDGDIIGIDIGTLYKGWVGDSCMTYAVGNIDDEAKRLLAVTSRCLELGIEQARAGNFIGDIGAVIQEHAEANGFSTVRELVGHGVGRSLHEDPAIPHYGTRKTGLKLRKGMVFTIEPMINTGGYATKLLSDRWTITTADGSRSAQYEHVLAITDGAAELLTVV